MNIQCPDCGKYLIENYFIVHSPIHRIPVECKIFLKCNNCKREYIPEITLHPRIKDIKISINIGDKKK